METKEYGRSGLVTLFILLLAYSLASCTQNITGEDNAGTILSGVVHLVHDLEVRPGKDLVISAGTRLIARGDFRIIAADGASVSIEGSAANPVTMAREGGGTWGGITVVGQGSLTVRFADIEGAPLIAMEGATLLIEDSHLHDYFESIPPIVNTEQAASATLTRVHISDFYETHFYQTLAVIENSLLERMTGDGIDFDNSPEGSTVRACTIRNSSVWNVDAIDFGVIFYPPGEPSFGLVEDCLIYDMTDKGISVGEGAARVEIKNSLIHHAGIGLSVKDASQVYAQGLTLADNNFGINCYEERSGAGGGVLSGIDLVILGNLVQVQGLDGSLINLGYSGIQASSESSDTTNIIKYVTDPDVELMDRPGRDYRLRAESTIASLLVGSGFKAPGYQGTIGATASPVGSTDFIPTPTKVAVYGDSRDGGHYHEKIVADLAYSESPDLVLHTGDMVNDGTDAAQWQAFATIVAPLRKIAPFYPVPGNHEGEASLYYDHFGVEKWYSVRKENALFIMLNTNILARPTTDADYIAQLTWLSQTLEESIQPASGIDFRFVTLHYPLYSIGSVSHPTPLLEFPNLEALASILEDPRWKVDMVFSGHNHFYERQDHNGTAYFVLGGGGAPLHDPDLADDLIGAEAFTKKMHYAILLINKYEANIEVRDLENTVIDTFGIVK